MTTVAIFAVAGWLIWALIAWRFGLAADARARKDREAASQRGRQRREAVDAAHMERKRAREDARTKRGVALFVQQHGDCAGMSAAVQMQLAAECIAEVRTAT